MVDALNRLNEYFDIRKNHRFYYLSSGFRTGVAGMEELYRQSQEILDGKKLLPKHLPCIG